MSFPYDLILFDLDGTLIETAPEIADAVNGTLKQLGLATVTQQQVNHWIGHGTRELLIQALAFVTHTPADTVRRDPGFAEKEAVFGGHYQKRCGTRSHLYPHVREALVALRSAGVKLVVMTNKEGRYTETVLNAHQMAPLFDLVISGDTFAVKKPNPMGIDESLKRFGAARDRTLFVGDSSIDIATARNGGLAVWAMPYGYNMGEPIAASQPDRVIPDFSALTSLLTGFEPGHREQQTP